MNKTESVAQAKESLEECLNKHGHTNGSRAKLRASIAFLAQQEAPTRTGSVLSDEQIIEIVESSPLLKIDNGLFEFARAIEAHVLASQPKLTLALPDYETRKIVIASDEMIDGERLVCVAITGADQPSAQEMRDAALEDSLHLLHREATHGDGKQVFAFVSRVAKKISALKSAPVSKQEPSAEAMDAQSANLMKFYRAETNADLIAAMAKHIEKLRAKLPASPDIFIPKFPRG